MTIVGTPVVYACRLSSAPVGKTYINQNVHDEVKTLYNNNISFNEDLLDIKHEGKVVVYETSIIWEEIELKYPEWNCN